MASDDQKKDPRLVEGSSPIFGNTYGLDNSKKRG